jgi:pimeloyl-ACP methyl ester carboxylesterase
MRGHIDMWPLRRRLRRAGFVTHQFSYPSLDSDIRAQAQGLAALIETLDDRPFHIVAHSLGGIVAIDTLLTHGTGHAQRVVTLGSPLAGSAVARKMAMSPRLRWLLGRSRDSLIHGIQRLPGDVEVGSIAGTRVAGIGRLFLRRDDANDGSVGVAETQVPGLTDHMKLPLSHNGLQLSASAARYTIRFLRDGTFGTTS